MPELAYVQPDHLGTPRVVIDPVRDVAIWEWSSKSEVFGDQAPANDPDGDGAAFDLALRFPGQQATEASGLFYNYQREYDAAVGRYSQSDPIGLDGGITTFFYAEGNPLSNIDPLGEMSRRKGERNLTRSPDGTDNPDKHWKDDPKRPGWGWQKDGHSGKPKYKKKPPYVLPPKAIGPGLALRVALQVACENGDLASCKTLCTLFPEVCGNVDFAEPNVAMCPTDGPSLNLQ
ncbi:putative deoxyribonuclease RhsC [compost metagenome]